MMSLPEFLSVVLHGLQVVGLLDLGLSFLAHRLLELLSLLRRRNIVLNATVFIAGQIDRLVLQWNLGCKSLQVTLGEQLSLEGLGALRC